VEKLIWIAQLDKERAYIYKFQLLKRRGLLEAIPLITYCIFTRIAYNKNEAGRTP
jgi:hypothetical protein